MSRRVSVLLALCMLMASFSLCPNPPEDIGPTVMSGDLSTLPSIEGSGTCSRTILNLYFGHWTSKKGGRDYPGLVMPFFLVISAKSSVRSCANAWPAIPETSLPLAAQRVTAQKISANSVILVENGQIIPQLLQHIAST